MDAQVGAWQLLWETKLTLPEETVLASGLSFQCPRFAHRPSSKQKRPSPCLATTTHSVVLTFQVSAPSKHPVSLPQATCSLFLGENSHLHVCEILICEVERQGSHSGQAWPSLKGFPGATASALVAARSRARWMAWQRYHSPASPSTHSTDSEDSPAEVGDRNAQFAFLK